MATAGRILIIPKGDYDASTTYEMLDLVNHNGASWLAKKSAVGIEPSVDNSEYWFMALGVAHDSIPIVNNLVTAEEGSALDATQGKVLKDAIESTDEKVSGIETELSETKTALSETATSLSEAETALASLSDFVAQMQSDATIITGTLAIGATSIILADERITTDSMLSIYTSVWGVNPTSVTVASGQVTLVFDARTSAMEVGVRIDG